MSSLTKLGLLFLLAGILVVGYHLQKHQITITRSSKKILNLLLNFVSTFWGELHNIQ